jgi:general secretion pathway protein N
MPSRLSWVALGVGAYLAFTLARFPAATAYAWFAPDALRLSGIVGTVWTGSAAFGSVPGMPLRDLRWSLRALPLVIGRVSGNFEARLADGFVSGEASASASRVRLTNVQASTSLAVLDRLLPLSDTQAAISVAFERFDLRDGWPTNATGTLRVDNLRVAPLLPTGSGPELIDLGSYEGTLVDSGDQGLRAQLQSTAGPLDVNGRAELDLDRTYRLEGAVRPGPDASPELVQGLNFMTGEPDAEGMRPFALTGSL